MAIRSHVEWFMFERRFIARDYDHVITSALALVPPGKQFNYVDLGANVGFFAVRVADLAFEFYRRAAQLLMILVEGSPKVCADLRSRMNVMPTNICCKVVFGVVGARQGEAYIHESIHHVSNGLVPTDRLTCRRSTQFIDVEALASDLEVIHLLKCTIEGQQEAFLKEYPHLLDKVVVGFMEVKRQEKADSCIQLLEARGFIVEHLRPWEDDESEEFMFYHPERCRLLAPSFQIRKPIWST